MITVLGLRHVGPRPVTLRYETVGDPAAPVVVVLGGISAGRHVVASTADPVPGWWQEQVGPGRPVDTDQHQVVAIDWVGADGSLDVPIDPADQADAIATVLEHLGLRRIRCVVGYSYGGAVALHVVIRHRHLVERAVIVSAADRPNPYACAYRSLQREVVRLGERTGAATEAVALARGLGMLSYRTTDEIDERFGDLPVLVGTDLVCAAESYLAARGASYAASWSAVAFRRLSESVDLHVVAPASVRVPCTFVAVEGDWLVPPAEVERLAAATTAPSRTTVITSGYGHDAFLKETEQIGAIVADVLAGDVEVAA